MGNWRESKFFWPDSLQAYGVNDIFLCTSSLKVYILLGLFKSVKFLSTQKKSHLLEDLKYLCRMYSMGELKLEQQCKRHGCQQLLMFSQLTLESNGTVLVPCHDLSNVEFLYTDQRQNYINCDTNIF